MASRGSAGFDTQATRFGHSPRADPHACGWRLSGGFAVATRGGFFIGGGFSFWGCFFFPPLPAKPQTPSPGKKYFFLSPPQKKHTLPLSNPSYPHPPCLSPVFS